jgi:carbon storage regulator
MLVLSRKTLESIMIGDDITITVLEIRGDQVRIGIEADINTQVNRFEVQERIDREREEQRREGGA